MDSCPSFILYSAAGKPFFSINTYKKEVETLLWLIWNVPCLVVEQFRHNDAIIKHRKGKGNDLTLNQR